MTAVKRITLTACVLICCVSCDQTTKSMAEASLTETVIRPVLGDILRLQLAYNRGAFLSLGATLPDSLRTLLFSAGVAIMLLGLLGYILFSKTVTPWETIALSLLLADGAGNLIDRILFGYVVDFMTLGIGSLRTGIFNVADIAVSIGVAMLLITALRTGNQTKTAS